MAILDDELFNDAQLDAEIVAYVKNQLPQELQERMDDEQLYYFHDLIEEYLAESGILESEADDEGYVNVDVEEIATYLHKHSVKDQIGDYSTDELLLLAEAELSYGDDFED
ncbi:MAG: hypothetical protein HUK09_07335 [Bacteroidaceae bacterium]|nr:hypothetical protein [Bacteroidaceae bacterium]